MHITFQTQRMVPYSYFPKTTFRNGREVGLSKKQPPNTQEHILCSHAHVNWICGLVQGQGPKMRHHSFRFPEFNWPVSSVDIADSLCEEFTRVMDILWGLQTLGVSVKHKSSSHSKSRSQSLETALQINEEPKGRYRSSSGKLCLQKPPSETWQQPTEQNWRTETERKCIFCSNELTLCKSGFMRMTFRHCQNKKFLKCLGHISTRLPARSS